MANVQLASTTPIIKVIADTSQSVITIDVPSITTTLQNNPTFISNHNISSLDQLLDVNLVHRTDGSTIIYDESTDTYFVEPLQGSSITNLDIDGGIY
jgi:hypothetical protein